MTEVEKQRIERCEKCSMSEEAEDFLVELNYIAPYMVIPAI